MAKNPYDNLKLEHIPYARVRFIIERASRYLLVMTEDVIKEVIEEELLSNNVIISDDAARKRIVNELLLKAKELQSTTNGVK